MADANPPSATGSTEPKRRPRRERSGPPDAWPPRAFAQGVGLLLQAIGGVTFFATTCTCCVTAFIGGGMWHSGPESIGPPPAGPTENPVVMAQAAILLVSAVGSLCLVGFGVGIQSDRGRIPAFGAALTTLVMTGVYGVAAFTLFRAGGQWPAFIVATALTMLALGLTLLTTTAMVEVFVHPPPHPGPRTIPAEAYTDPLSVSADRTGDGTLKAEIRRKRERLRRQLEEIDELERSLEDGDEVEDDEPWPEPAPRRPGVEDDDDELYPPDDDDESDFP
ncbi:MAG: hypothetical protein ACF8PN_05245 [Phycisphaerales bacterium]